MKRNHSPTEPTQLYYTGNRVIGQLPHHAQPWVGAVFAVHWNILKRQWRYTVKLDTGGMRVFEEAQLRKA